MSFVSRLTALTPASEDSSRVSPPGTTFDIFRIPAWAAAALISSSRSGRVTRIISSIYADASKARSVCTISFSPPSGAVSLSVPPIRLDVPAPTMTAAHLGVFLLRRDRIFPIISAIGHTFLKKKLPGAPAGQTAYIYSIILREYCPPFSPLRRIPAPGPARVRRQESALRSGAFCARLWKGPSPRPGP